MSTLDTSLMIEHQNDDDNDAVADNTSDSTVNNKTNIP